VIKYDIISAAAEAAGVERQKAMQAVEAIIDALRQDVAQRRTKDKAELEPQRVICPSSESGTG
jgi:hypothetical protein